MGGGAGQRSGRQNFSGRLSPFAEFGGPRMRQMLADFESRRRAAPAQQPMMPRMAPTQMTTQPAIPMAPGQAMTQDMDIMRRQAEMQRMMMGGAGQQMPPQFSGGIGAFAPAINPMNPMMAGRPSPQQEAEYQQFMFQNNRQMTPMGPMTGQQISALPPEERQRMTDAFNAAAIQQTQGPRMPTPGEAAAFGEFNAPQPGMSPKGQAGGRSPMQLIDQPGSMARPGG